MKTMIRKTAVLLLAALSAALLAAQTRNIEVWDFGGVAESGAVNHISVADIDALEGIAADGKFTAGEFTFGDLTLKTDNNDRAYYDGKKNYGTQGYSSFTFDDGYMSSGMYYCNGKGGESKRYLLLRNVKAGDVVTFYARISNSGDEKIHFSSVNEEGERTGAQDEVAQLGASSVRYTYIASVSGSYKVWAEASTGKPVYYRIKRVPAVEILGNLQSLPAGAAILKFVVKETKQELRASVAGNSYTASLPAGYNFTAVLTGIKGYGVSAATKNVALPSDAKGEMRLNLEISEQKTYVVDGKITGISASYKSQSPIMIIMNPPEGSAYLPVEIAVTQDADNYTFSGELEPSVAYTAVLSGANDYAIKGDSSFEGTSAFTKDITVAQKPLFSVSGSFFGETDPLPAAITFKNIDDGYVYSGTISSADKTYSVKLRSGAYEVQSASAKASTMNHVVVNGKNTTKNIKLTATDKSNQSSQSVKLKKDIYVGGKKADYATVKEAIAAAAAMNPKSESDRITIHIAPGVYRAQLIINTPYITLKNDTPAQEVKLTWYYGIGYNYYSANASGFYDEDLAYDKFAKHGAARWGVATYIQKDAKFFRAEGITFESSFNKYVTDEEIEDGVESDGSILFERKLNSDVRTKKATERSAAICSEAEGAEYYRCRFLGSQDTLYTGANTRQYYRNCYIEGNTDFIFGDGDVVFENCEIAFAGYTDIKAQGYLTAARNALLKGYLFYNCVISADNGVYQTPGMLGRPWGDKASVAWVNTIFGNAQVIDERGWTDMSGNQAKNANFREYNSLWDKKAVDTSQRTAGTLLENSNGFEPKDFFGTWEPFYYTKEAGASVKLKKGSFTTDDDINTPYPGHTITLHYSLGKADSEDASLIQWYRVKDGKETLVKQSAGFADKTYLITKEDSGANIKAVITPMTRGGKAAKEVTVKLDKKINEGYAVPANAKVDRPRAIGKVNIFLASDSTCKDYSANGMWNGGQTRNEGAWGEFLQCYFNEAVAIQNYANGGRSSRNFINEGSLDLIAKNIGKGDYLFIQFGHNDCSNGSGYLEDRYVPLGQPDKKGIYPVTEGKKVATPASYASKYGDTFYAYDSGGTYKWYLKQYIEVARKAGAIPVLITPVSRQYFGSDGKITPHHDSKDKSTKTQTTTNNAYVEAVRQLAKEENVTLIDGFEITKTLYEKARAEKDTDTAKALMFEGDSTHNNKLGGFIVAGEFAKAIKKAIPALQASVIQPVKAIGENADKTIVFSVNSNAIITCASSYWQNYAQEMIDSLK